MKIISLLVALFATTSFASACGSNVTAQSFPSVPLSEFGVNSILVAKPLPVVAYTYKFVCVTPQAQILNGIIVDQKFPSVPLSEFGIDSWKTAK